MTTVAVTGSTGFLGQSVVASLGRHGVRVVTIGRAEAPTSEGLIHAQFDLLSGTAAEVTAVFEDHDVDVLVHLAWDVTYPTYWSSSANQLWRSATQRLLTSFWDAGGRRVVVAGTCAELDQSAAQTEYVKAKLETLRWLESSCPGESAWLRVFYPTGPNEHSGRLVPSLVSSAETGVPIHLQNPSLVRDYFHVDDAGDAFAAAAIGSATGIYDVGTGGGLRVSDVYERVAAILPNLPAATYGPESDPQALVASTRSMAESFGWRSTFTGVEAIGAAVRWRLRQSSIAGSESD